MIFYAQRKWWDEKHEGTLDHEELKKSYHINHVESVLIFGTFGESGVLIFSCHWEVEESLSFFPRICCCCHFQEG